MALTEVDLARKRQARKFYRLRKRRQRSRAMAQARGRVRHGVVAGQEVVFLSRPKPKAVIPPGGAKDGWLRKLSQGVSHIRTFFGRRRQPRGEA